MSIRIPSFAALCAVVVLAGCGQGDGSRGQGEHRVAPSQRESAAPRLSEADRAALEALGYSNTVPGAQEDSARSGVVLHDRRKASGGLNLFNLRDESAALLMDMEGKILRRWSSPVKGETYRKMKERAPLFVPSYLEGWNLVKLLPGGDLLVVGSHHMLLRLDRDSKPRWKLDLSVHHDVDVAADGGIVVLDDSVRVIPFEGEPVAFQDNSIVVVSAAGRVERRISIYDAMSGRRWREMLAPALRRVVAVRGQRLAHLRRLAARAGRQGEELARLYAAAIAGELAEDPGIKNVLFHSQVEDIFHSNSVRILRADVPGLWRTGDFLVSIRSLDLVVVVDHRSGRVVWGWGRSELQGAHHATEVAGGHIQIFDNGTRRGYSRVIEVDPRSEEIVWSYEGSPRSSFFSASRGSCQRLRGDNVLITETDRGRAFEVTRAGEIVWSFLSDVRPTDPRAPGPSEAAERAAIYRMTRIAREAAPLE